MVERALPVGSASLDMPDIVGRVVGTIPEVIAVEEETPGNCAPDDVRLGRAESTIELIPEVADPTIELKDVITPSPVPV